MSVKEPWDETDEGGTVTFATVQTVSTKNNAHSLALYTCQLSRLRRESHACGLKTSISRRLTPAGQFLTPD